MQHRRTHHTTKPIVSIKKTTAVKPQKSRPTKKALNTFSIIRIEATEENAYDLHIFNSQITEEIENHIFKTLHETGSIKWHLIHTVRFQRVNDAEETETMLGYFRCEPCPEHIEETVRDHLIENLEKIKTQFEEFVQLGSGWVLDKISHTDLYLSHYKPLAGSSYIETPQKLASKHALINIQNFNDQKCLIWSLLAHKKKIEKNAERVSNYTSYEHEIILDDIPCPVSYHRIKDIEIKNNLRINVYSYDEENKEFGMLYISNRTHQEAINLLLIGNDDGNTHYIYIKHFSRLFSHLTQYNGEVYFCYRCLHRFMTQELRDNHLQYCSEHAPQHIKMPEPDKNILKFNGYHFQHLTPYTIIADFESLIVPIHTTEPNPSTSYTIPTQMHIPCGYAYIIIDQNGKKHKDMKTYLGPNAVQEFLTNIFNERDELAETLNTIKPMKLSKEQEKSFREATVCCICGEFLGDKRCRDHNHVTGVYRGAAHMNCNLQFKQSKVIPVIFHNLKHYDGHHLMTELGQFPDYSIDVIANTMEKYISFTIKKKDCPVKLRFLDSYQFLPASLEKLTANLQPTDFHLLKANFPDDTDLSLLTRKGIYPYSYFTDFQKFDETQLPPPSAFHNDLTDEPISDEDYQHAHNVWEKFKIQNLGQYHNLYVKCDVLLLADIFQNFRKLCGQYYKIDPTHMFTSPGLAWQACLRMTRVQLELLTDIDMLLFFEKGVRGGVSAITRRYAKANNPDTPDYDENNKTSHIMYWDANNLYGWSMSQFLPVGEFQWLESSEINESTILSHPDNADYGFVLEVDLHYPPTLHHLHNDYPLAPENLNITEDMLSPYAKSLLNNRPFKGSSKLSPNLKDKKHYIIHYRNLKLYLQLGLILTKIHKVIKFRQAPWLKPYIEFNTDKRKQATSSFEKDFFKLLNNSVFGKTMENLRLRRNIELCNNEKRSKKLVASPTFSNFKIFNEGLVAVERVKTTLTMNRPIYVGFAILELAKLHMYKFHYNIIKKHYQDRAQLLFTDTDSLTYHIHTDNMQQDMKTYQDEFDFSDYPKNHPLYSEKNKKTIGKFKDEMNGKTIFEFVGIKAKMYSILSEDGEKKRAKGVPTSIVRKKIKHSQYFNCIHHLKTLSTINNRIQQDHHQLYTIKQQKLALSPFDDKRFILEDGITSLAYGHHQI